MKRRRFLWALGVGAVGAGADWMYPEQGIWNPCRAGRLPTELARHDLVLAAWEGIDPTQVWDCHVHLTGTGDSDSGIWLTPDMDSLAHPIQYAQKRFFLNAGCAEVEQDVDQTYVARLMGLLADMAPGAKAMLLAFDYHHDAKGRVAREHSAFYTPDAYAARLAAAHPERLEWIASIHPYREDAVEALRDAAAKGVRAIKWLPPAQGMDPASPLCDPFYEEMARLGLPLLTHAGAELAVWGSESADYGNPLRLRRPLRHGVRVLVAHCATLGAGVDLDRGADGARVHNFDLFARLMDEADWRDLLYGEISAITQINRIGRPLETLLRREDWHGRLLNGSDYPLPAVFPLFSLRGMVADGYLTQAEADVLRQLRQYNPLLFDFVLKRRIRHQGQGFPAPVFHTRRIFQSAS